MTPTNAQRSASGCDHHALINAAMGLKAAHGRGGSGQAMPPRGGRRTASMPLAQRQGPRRDCGQGMPRPGLHAPAN
jgi:hypothetical protein